MAEHTRKFYTCDRCGIEMDSPVRGAERGPTAFTMSAFSDVGVGRGPLFKWNDLCLGCNSLVGDAARQLAADARADRAAAMGNQTP